jgi:predicted component of type VI protein secretion system
MGLGSDRLGIRTQLFSDSFRGRLYEVERIMRAKLKVLHGSNAGKEITISKSKFLIGRGEGCSLRPSSDTVSRQHCVLIVREGQMFVRDLKSRNGTLVNGERIEEERQLKPSDQLKVGKLEFEVLIDYGLGGQKRPEVKSVKEAAARVTTAKVEEGNVTDWLEEGDEVDRERRASDPDTRQLKLDDTERITLEKASSDAAASGKSDADAKSDEASSRPEKKQPGKLPKLPETQTKNSREAAANMLKKFFNRR